MTTEEKLKHFEDVCTGNAKEKYDQMICDYTASLEKIQKEHEQNLKHQAELEIQAETEKLRRDINRRLSIAQIDIKRQYSKKQEELRGKIFSELRDRLAVFMESPEYMEMLEAQIKGQGLCRRRGNPYLHRPVRQIEAESPFASHGLRRPRQRIFVPGRNKSRDRFQKHPDRQFI